MICGVDMTKDEAIHKALKVLNCLNNDRVYETAWVKGAINACEEALEQQEIGEAEIRQMLNDIEYYQKRVEALEQPAQEPVAWLSTNSKANEVIKTHQWHGLSDDEIWDIANFLGKNKEWDYPVMFAKTIEKVLREKNNV